MEFVKVKDMSKHILKEAENYYTIRIKNGLEVEIRNICVEDVDGILMYLRELASECEYTFMEPEEIEINNESVINEKNFIQYKINNPDTLYLVVEHRDQIIGQITVTILAQKRMNHVAVFGISLRKDFRGMGLGNFLMDRAIEWCREKGVLKLEAGVFSTNRIAQNLFKKFGFICEGTLKKHITHRGTYIDYLQMGRWL